MTAYTAAVERVTQASTLADYYAARLVLQAAWNAALRAMLTPEPEPCARCRGRMVVIEYRMQFPCPECCTIEMSLGD